MSRRLSEIAAAQALKGLRAAATRGGWGEVDRLLAEAQWHLAGNAWVAAVVASMTSIATSRSRERLSKEACTAQRNWSTAWVEAGAPVGQQARGRRRPSGLPALQTGSGRRTALNPGSRRVRGSTVICPGVISLGGRRPEDPVDAELPFPHFFPTTNENATSWVA